MVGFTFTLLALLGWRVSADGEPSFEAGPRYINYQGTVEKDGINMDGIVEMRFDLRDESLSLEAPSVWSEVQQVSVQNGRFSVLLGASSEESVSALVSTVQNADSLQMEVSIHEGDQWVNLSGQQHFAPLPFAMWTTSGTNFRVATLDGPPDSMLFLNATTQQPVVLGGNLSIDSETLLFGSHPTRGDGGRILNPGNDNKLIVNFSQSMDGGTDIQGPTTVEGNLSIHGNLTVNGDVNLPYRLLKVSLFDLGQSTSANFDAPVGQWNCMVGGVEMREGDIDEDGTEDPIYYYTSLLIGASNWKINVDLDSHNTHETHKVGLGCFRSDISERVSWW